jgi:hypothetical protein
MALIVTLIQNPDGIAGATYRSTSSSEATQAANVVPRRSRRREGASMNGS